MKKKTKLLIGVPLAATIAVLFILGYLFGWPVKADEILSATQAANYCASNEECVVSPTQCQFVEQLINAREYGHIAKLQRYYVVWGGTCWMMEYSGVYDFSRRSCSNGKCVAPRISKAGVDGAPAATAPTEGLREYGK